MEQNVSDEGIDTQEETQLITQDDDLICTGVSCSQLDQSKDCPESTPKHTKINQEIPVVTPDFSGSCTDPCNSSAEKLSTHNGSDENGLKVKDDESFDPDITYIDESLVRVKTKQIAESVSSELKNSSKDISDTDNSLEQQNSCSYSQECTQLLSQTQDVEQPLAAQGESIPETSFHLKHDNSYFSASGGVKGTQPSETYSDMETLEIKQPSNNVQENQESKIGSVVSSSTSSSQTISTSSSSSKRPTDSDDTDELPEASQDMFGSQSSFPSSQALSTSQFLPTLQLSGDIPSSQSYEGFIPSRLNPFTPTSKSQSTSTPLSKTSGNRRDVISLSDEEDIQKFSEKRKLSDSSDENKPSEKKPKKQTEDTRQSIVVMDEFRCQKSSSGTQDESLGSQGFNLYLSQIDTDGTSPSNPSNSFKSNGNESKTETVELLGIDVSKDSSQSSSVVHLDDVEDEVQLVSPHGLKSNSVGEIQILDSSGPQRVLSTSGDIEVLSPLCSNLTFNTNGLAKISSDLSLNKKILESNSKSSHSGPPGLQTSADFINGRNESAKSEKEANLQEFSTNFVMTFTCTYAVTCKTVIDMNKKETISNSIPSFEVIESNTVVKRDSSPSAVEESSPGRGGGSPGSCVSGPGPFPLQPSRSSRLTMFSTTSSSSSGSSASAYRQGYIRRGRPSGDPALWKIKEPLRKQSGPIPWKDLLQQCQDELSHSGAAHLEKWAASPITNSSSDEGRIVEEEKGLEPVPEDSNDGEEVFGVPKRNKNLSLRKRTDSSHSASDAPSVQKDAENEEVPKVKLECETPPAMKRKRGRPPKSATPGTPRGSAKKRTATPQKKLSELPNIENNSSIPEDSSLSSGTCYFSAGTQVFALWKDKGRKAHFWPGQIESAVRTNYWNVAFNDGYERVLHRNDILIINTFEIGQLVEAKPDGKTDYAEGKIIEVTPLKGGEDLFHVQFDTDENVTVTLSNLRLSEEQAQYWRNGCPVSNSSSSSPSKRGSASKCYGGDHEILKNLDTLHDLPVKRVRTPKGAQSVQNSPGRPGPSNTARRLIADGNYSSTADDEPLAALLAREKVGPLSTVGGVDPEQVGFATADPLARKGKGVKNSASKKPLPDIENEKIVQELGPIPPEGSKIFSGYTFILTKTDVLPGRYREPVTDSEVPQTDQEERGGSDASDCESFKFSHCPMVKDRLARQIIGGGGKVIKSWTEIVSKEINNTFVVSNRPCLTPIYLHCIARGVKSINHDYIIDCCRKNSKFSLDYKNNYLPVGYSHVRKDFVPWREHKSKSPLQGQNILVVGDDDKNFKAFWDDFLRITGAKVSSAKTSKGMTMVTKVISDFPCSESILKRAEELNVPVLSPAWMTQSLIENKNLSATKLKRFAFDFMEQE